MNSSSGWFAVVCPIFFCWLHLSVATSLILPWLVLVLFYSIPVYYFSKWRRDATARNHARKAAVTEEEGKKVENVENVEMVEKVEMVEMVEMDVPKTEKEEQKLDDNSNGNHNNENNNNSNENYFGESVIAPPSNSSGASFVASSTPSANVIVTDAEER